MNTQISNHMAGGNNNEHPALYVGTYAKYNNGSLGGGWVDVASFQNGADFIKFCTTELHKDERDPELMFQDYMNFPEYLYRECMSADSIDEILQWYKEENEERKEEAAMNMQIVDYNEGVSIAVIGDTYPFHTELKNMRGIFRKHKDLGPCWVFSAKRRAEIEKFISSGKTSKTAKTTKESNVDTPDKTLLEEYLNEMRKVWHDESMIEHYRKTTSRVIRLENGSLLPFGKPKIETKFCFGYSTCGQGMTYDEANKCAQKAESEEYFLYENLKEFDKNIKALEGKTDENDYYYNNRNFYIYRQSYLSQKEPLNVFCYGAYHPYDITNGELRADDISLMSDGDRKRILAAEKAEKAAFEKRLHAYLKRYGTSKLDIWTYWVDE